MNVSERTQDQTDSGHPSIERLNAFAVGQLSEDDFHEVERHLAACTSCNQALETSPNDSFVALLRQGDSLVQSGPSSAVGPSRVLHSVPGYTLLERLGEGGMGVVWKARQDGLNRLVALKRLRSASARSAEALTRFRREAESVARLQHPNIAQIYEIGEHEGEPYLALEFVGGGSLAQKLAAGPLPPGQAAALVETLARAMHHAHEQGIIHRDLKPGNVLLTDDGTPKIGDFGLAKQLDEATAHTQTGAVLGTPSYMAPEQTDGGQTAIGPAADIYALGATLYETLTGRPPFRGPTVLETLAQVREREPVPPGQLQPSVPADLQTICLKCLHKEPARRYDSAAALADDLSRFLHGNPIHARPVTARERMWKWARRKPALALLLAVCNLLLTTLIVGGVVYNARLRSTAERAEDKEAETRQQYRQAHDTLQRMLNRLESQRLVEVPQLKELQRSLLEDALAFYLTILQRADSPDPAVRRDAAMACKRAADIQQMLGQLDAAAENYRRVIELTESLPAEDRDSPEIQTLQAGSYMNWGSMARGSDRFQHAEQRNRAALERFERLVQERPDDPTLRNELAKAEHNRGVLFLNANPVEAESHYSRSITIRTALVRDHPEEESYQAELAADYQDLGLLYNQTNRPAEAAALYPKAEALLRPLMERHAAERKYALYLVPVYVNWSYHLARAGRSQEALERLDSAVRLAEDMHRREPKDGTAHWQALQAHGARAEIREFVERFADAAKDWDRVIELASGPERLRRRGSRSWCLVRAGDHARAVAGAGESAALPEATDQTIYYSAAIYSLAIGPALSDMKLSATEREHLAERYALQAMALLRRLQEKGYFRDASHAKALKTDEKLQLLRNRDDFIKFVNEAAKPVARSQNP